MAVSEVSSELLATYAGLGTYDGGQYFRGEECLACVKDLIRALREDDSQCEIRRHLGRAGILEKDLLHILVDCGDQPALRNDVVRLLVNLTQPAYLCFGNTYPQGKETELMKCFMEVNTYLRGYKKAFTTEAPMSVLGSLLSDLCQKEWEEKEDEDVIVIERILLLIRNLLHISSEQEEEKRTEEDVNVHDVLIWNLHINGIDELLLFLGSSPAETQWCMHVLEIFFLLFKEQSPTTLASTGKTKSGRERRRDEEMMEEVLLKEKVRTKHAQSVRSTRHSRFGGTFVVKDQKSISGGERVYHRPLADFNTTSYDTEKRPRRKDKRRRPVTDVPKKRVSAYSIRLVLKNLCVKFLECCYNPLMKVVKENIMRHRAMDNDETYYLWCLRFFMEFNRVHDFRVDIVGETLHLPILHYLITLIANYYESMVIEKRSVINARQWGQRLHYVVQGYKEILLYIQHMTKSGDKGLQESAKVIMSNVFYHAEYREVFVTLLRNFYEVFQTRAFLRDTVETAHVYVKMMDDYSRQNQHMIVQEKRRGGGGKGGAKKKKKGPSNKALTEDQLIDLWETIDGRLEELMEGVEPLPASHSPFDPTSRFSVDDQKVGTMGQIRMLLIDAEHPEAVSLLRAARGVWPGAEFGNPGLTVDEEMDVMRDVLFNPVAALPATHLLEGEEGDSDEEGGGAHKGSSGSTVELEFSFKSYLERFANNKIVRVYGLLLADYSSNTDTTNHAVVKMIYRIAIQLQMCPLLFHISIFTSFLAILNEPSIPRFKDLQKLARHVVQSFFHMASSNSLMFVELLLWKTSKDCYELKMGYGTLERERELAKRSTVWTREQEEELTTLYQMYKEEEDVVGCLEAALEGSEVKRTRRQIASQLVKMSLVEKQELQRRQQKKKKGAWSEEEVERLKQVFTEEQEVAEDPKSLARLVANHFPHRGVNNVKNQLREVGLLERPAKRGRGKSDSGEVEANKKFKSAEYIDTSDDESSDAESAHSTGSHSPPSRRSSVGGRGPDREGGRGTATTGGRGPVEGVNVSECVRELCGCGHGGVLQWLQAYLTDEARDRALDDEWEEMCIVMVSEGVASAMKSSLFQQLLTALGLQPPTPQEPNWKIPASLSPKQLTDIASALTHTGHVTSNYDDQSQDSADHVTSVGKSHDLSHDLHLNGHLEDYDSSGGDEDEDLSRNDALKLLVKKRNPGKDTQSETPPSKRPHLPPQSKAPPKRPRLALQSEFLEWEGEEEEGEEGERGELGEGEMRKSLQQHRGRKWLESDSSEDEEGMDSSQFTGKSRGESESGENEASVDVSARGVKSGGQTRGHFDSSDDDEDMITNSQERTDSREKSKECDNTLEPDSSDDEQLVICQSES